MAWPVSQDYNEAIQDPPSSFHDPELKAGEATTNALGMPMPRSGNFADVYEFMCPATKSKWAIKCFTRHVTGLRERYMEISRALVDAKLPFTVDFQYLVQGIRVRGEWYPILKMRWVEGLLLNEFVRDNLDKPVLLGQLGMIWGRMSKRLRDNKIAHADLQHGNVILVPGSKNSSLAVKLIDYDGMFVPALAKSKSGEVGHPNYQHPQRLRDGTYNCEVDRFPLLVVATSLRALSIGGRELWDRYDNGDNLLFRETDLKTPDKSALFKELREMTDPQTQKLVEELQRSIQRKLEEVPAIDELLPETKPTSVRAAAKTAEAPAIVATVQTAEEPQVVEGVPEGEEAAFIEPKRKSSQPKSKVPMMALIGGGAVAAFVLFGLLAAGVAFVVLNKNKGGGPIVQNPPVDGRKDKDKNDDKPPIDPNKDKIDPNKDKIDPNKDKPPVIPPAVGEMAARVLELPKSAGRALLSPDGARLAYAHPNAGQFAYRDAPAFDQEHVFQAVVPARGPIAPIAFSLDGKKLAIAADADTGPVIHIFNSNGLTIETTLQSSQLADTGAFSPDGKYFLSMRRREMAQGTKSETNLELHDLSIAKQVNQWKLSFEPRYFGFKPSSDAVFYTGATRDMVSWWDIPGASGGFVQVPHPSRKHFYSPDFSKIAILVNPNEIEMFLKNSGQSKGKISAAPNVVFHGAGYSGDNKYLLIGAGSEIVGQSVRGMLVDLKDGKTVAVTEPFAGVPQDVSLGSNGFGLLQGPDMLPRLYRFPLDYVAPPKPPMQFALSGKFEPNFIADVKTFGDACLSADGERLVYRLPRNNAFAYRKAPDFGAEFEVEAPGVNSGIDPLISFRDGKKIVLATSSSNKEASILIWNVSTNQIERTMPIVARPRKVALSPDQKYLAAETLRPPPEKGRPPIHEVFLFEIESSRLVKSWQTSTLRAVGFSPDSTKMFFWQSSAKSVEAFSVTNGANASFVFSPGTSLSNAFSYDFTKMAKTTPMQLEILDVESKGRIATLTNQDTKLMMRNPAFAPDGNHVVVSVEETPPGQPPMNGRAVLFDVRTSEILSVTPPFPHFLSKVQVAANGVGMINGSGNVRLYRFPIGSGALLVKNPPAPVAPATPGFVQLFNGKDLTGWNPAAPDNVWRVENGQLVSPGTYLGLISTKRSDYKDFHLRVEARVDTYGGAGGAGCVIVRNSTNDNGYLAHLHNVTKRAGFLLARAPNLVKFGKGEELDVPLGDWFVMDVFADGDRIRVLINGVQTAEYEDKDKELTTTGRIVLRQHDKSILHVRKIEIKELEAKPGIVTAPDGFVPLFNGKDLTGWMPKPGEAADWRVVNGILTTNARSLLFTTRDDFADFHLRAEVRTLDENSTGVFWRYTLDAQGYEALFGGKSKGRMTVRTVSPEGGNGRSIRNLGGSYDTPGGWLILEIIAEGNRMVVKANGQTLEGAVDAKSVFSRGRIGLRGAMGVEYRSIAVKELNAAVAAAPMLKGEGQLVNRNSGLVLGVFGAVKSNGGGVVQWQSTKDAPNQYWSFVPSTDGWFHIVNADSGAFLSVRNNSTNVGASLEIWSKKEGERSQEWKPVSSDKNDAKTFKIVNRASGKVISIPNASMTAGNPGFLQNDSGAIEQTWKFEAKDAGVPIAIKPKDEPGPAKRMRAAVPDAEKVTESEKSIREQFAKEYAKKAPADLAALADKLFLLSKETADDPPGRYALLREAASLAAKAGKVDMVMKATGEITTIFDVDETAAKVEALLSLSKTTLTTDASKQFVEAALTFAAAAAMDENFDVATKVLLAADSVARRVKNTTLLAQIQKQDTQAKAMAKEHGEMKKAMETLAKDAKDPGANLIAGTYLAFRKGDFDKGLPHLALSGQAEFQDLAKKDVDEPDDNKARIELGDAWWNAGEKKTGQQKLAMQWRAAHWYRIALPSLTGGLTQTRVAGRVKQIDELPAPFRMVTMLAEVDRFKGHTGMVYQLTLAADGKRVISCSADGTVREWNYVTGKARVLVGPPLSRGPLLGFAIAPDEKHIAMLTTAGKFSVIHLPTLTVPKSAKNERDALPGLHWLTDTRIAYAWKSDHHTWEPIQGGGGGSGPLIFGGADATRPNARAMVVSPDHDFGAALCQGGPVGTFRIMESGGRGGGPRFDFDATAGAFSKNSKSIVLGAKDGAIKVFSMTGGAKELAALSGTKGVIRCLAFTPDGQRIVSGGDDRNLRVWDAVTGKELQRFPHPGTVMSLVTTPDNRYVISACADAVIRVWSLSAAGTTGGGEDPPMPKKGAKAENDAGLELKFNAGLAGVTATLNATDTPYMGKASRQYLVPLVAGRTYEFRMNSTAFDAYLYLEDPDGRLLAQDDDSGGNLNSRILYTPNRAGRYRVIATPLGNQRYGEFTLTIK